jgi:hypothetical protein
VFNSRTERESRIDLSLDADEHFLVGLRDRHVRDDLIEFACVWRKLGEGSDQCLGQRQERLDRLGPEVEKAGETRSLREGDLERRKRGQHPADHAGPVGSSDVSAKGTISVTCGGIPRAPSPV